MNQTIDYIDKRMIEVFKIYKYTYGSRNLTIRGLIPGLCVYSIYNEQIKQLQNVYINRSNLYIRSDNEKIKEIWINIKKYRKLILML